MRDIWICSSLIAAWTLRCNLKRFPSHLDSLRPNPTRLTCRLSNTCRTGNRPSLSRKTAVAAGSGPNQNQNLARVRCQSSLFSPLVSSPCPSSSSPSSSSFPLVCINSFSFTVFCIFSLLFQISFFFLHRFY